MHVTVIFSLSSLFRYFGICIGLQTVAGSHADQSIVFSSFINTENKMLQEQYLHNIILKMPLSGKTHSC